MGKLLERLSDPTKSGVYRSGASEAIEDALRGGALHLVVIDLGDAADKAQLLERLARVLGFPAWFGANWDALADCLSDLSCRPAAGWVLLFKGFEKLAADEQGIFIDVLASAADAWPTRGKPFF